MDRDISFADLLRRHRRAAGLTQQGLAEKALMSVEAVSALERGARRHPRPENVQFLGDALGLTDEQRTVFAAVAARPRKPPASDLRRTGSDLLRPRQLPPAPTHFVGRRQHIDSLVDVLTRRDVPSASICAVAGMGGVGKTALALHVAHLVADRFPDGQLFVDLRGYGPGKPMPAIEAIGQLLRSLGVAGEAVPIDLDEAAARLRSEVFGHRLLIVLDNASDAAHVAPMLPASHESAAIVTSRQVLSSLPGGRYVELGVLTPAEGLDLLADATGRDRTDSDADAAQRAVVLCGGLPLAVRLIGSRLAAREAWPVAFLADRLADQRRTLDELGTDDVGVRASFAVSIDHLVESESEWDRRAGVAFPALGLLDGPDLSTAVAAMLLDASEVDAERILERLADDHLLDAPQPGRYQLHDLLRVYAREVAVASTPAAVVAAAITRVVGLYAAAAWQSYELIHGPPEWPHGGRQHPTGLIRFAETGEALAWLDAERHHVLATLRQAVATEGVPGDLIVSLALGLFGFYSIRTHAQDWLEVNRLVIPVALAADDVEGAAWLRRHMSRAQIDLGRYPEAIGVLREALAAFRKLGAVRGQIACSALLAIVLRRTGELDDAITYGSEAVALSEQSGDREAEAQARAIIGAIWWSAGDRERAFAACLDSLAIWEGMERGHGQITVVVQLGMMHRENGEPEQSLAYLERAVATIRRLSSRVSESNALDELGQSYVAVERFVDALDAFDEGIATAQDSCDRVAEASLWHHRGKALAALGQPAEAREDWLRALKLYGDQQPGRVDEVQKLLRSTAP